MPFGLSKVVFHFLVQIVARNQPENYPTFLMIFQQQFFWTVLDHPDHCVMCSVLLELIIQGRNVKIIAIFQLIITPYAFRLEYIHSKTPLDKYIVRKMV